MSLSQDNREVDAFAAEHARRNQLTPQAREALAAKTHALVAWLKRFRRTIGAALRYPEAHPQRGAAIAELLEETHAFGAAHGVLEVRLEAGHCTSDAGFPLPNNIDSESAAYTFYPFYRDGVAKFALAPNVQPYVLQTLLDAVSVRGGEPVDTFMRLWHAQGPTFYIEGTSSMDGRSASAFSAVAPRHIRAVAYLEALTAAAPFYASGDVRPMFTTATLDGLAGHGIDADTAIAMLTTAEGAAESLRVTPDGANAVRRLFEHDGDRDARVEALRRLHLLGGP